MYLISSFHKRDIVRPANYCSSSSDASDAGSGECIELSKWDIMMLTVGYTQRGLLYSCKEEDKSILVTRLKTSLALTLDHFFPLAGRLAVRKHNKLNVNVNEIATSSVYIDCNSTGAEFIHAIADNITISNILDPVVNRSVCDGTSLWHFMNSWSEISRESSTTTPGFSSSRHISGLPFLTRWFPESMGIPIQLPFSIDSKSFKETYISATTATKKTTTKISSLQALLAHFWVAITGARCLDQDDETSYLLVVSYRDRLNPPVCQEYFGNLCAPALVTVKVGDLLERGIGWGAVLLNQVIMSHNHKAIRSSWDSWIENPIPFAPVKRFVTSSPKIRQFADHGEFPKV
ncbi:hypothetical protein C5167_027330 [Papaver somniferum]|nr:hypothetical protein C5167_027330 [Papaver somniferum]